MCADQIWDLPNSLETSLDLAHPSDSLCSGTDRFMLVLLDIVLAPADIEILLN